MYILIVCFCVELQLSKMVNYLQTSHLIRFVLLFEIGSVHHTSVCLTFILLVCLRLVVFYRKSLLVKCELFLVQSCWRSRGDAGEQPLNLHSSLTFFWMQWSALFYVLMYLLLDPSDLYQLGPILWVHQNALMGHLFNQLASIREWSMQFVMRCVNNKRQKVTFCVLFMISSYPISVLWTFNPFSLEWDVGASSNKFWRFVLE